jgi:hypothetical protein
MKALSTNTLVNHTAYPKILQMYNEELQTKGRVNNKKFYEEVVRKEIPSYSMGSWYFFLKRFKQRHGIVAVEKVVDSPNSLSEKKDGETAIVSTMLSNQEATAQAIQRALNIGNDRLKQIMENPSLMTAKEAIDLIFKAMKAQDSRIHAVGKVREDNREEEKMQRAFDNSAYGA